MPSGAPKSSVYPIRFDKDELSLLRKFSKEFELRSVAALLRLYIRIGMGLPSRELARLHEFQEMLRQLRGMANNLNQMTKAANAGKFRLDKRTEQSIEEMRQFVEASCDLLNDYQDSASIKSIVRAQAYFEAKRKSTSQKLAAVKGDDGSDKDE